MRMLVDFSFPPEPFNSMVRDGTAGEAIQRIIEDIKPEAVYFTARHGKRGGMMIVDLPEPARMVATAEPLFLTFDATVEFHPAMLAEDLAASPIDEIGKRYAERAPA